MAQYIIFLDSKRVGADKFVVKVLDSTHLLIQPEAAETVQRLCRQWMDANTYEKPTN